MAALNFGDQRPRLLECRLDARGSRLIVENNVRGGEVLFPLDRKPLLERLDGKRTIKEIVSELYKSSEHPGFRALITTLQSLHEHGPLENFNIAAPGGQTDEEAFFDINDIWLFRPLYRRTLVSRAELKISNATVFFLFSAMVAMVAIFAPSGILRMPSQLAVLRIHGGYAWALPLLFACLSVMKTSKSLLKSMAVLVATGRLYSLELKVKWYGIFLDVSDHGIFHSSRPAVIVVYQLVSLLFYFFVAAVIRLVVPSASLHSTLGALAILMTLADTHPYHRSDLTRLLSVFWGERQLMNMIPYLKSRSLFALFSRTGKLANENAYLIYSVLALTWVSLGMTASLKILRDNLPLIMAKGLSGPYIDYFSRSVLGIGLFILFLYSLSDIFTTVSRNVLWPLFKPLAILRQRVRSKATPAIERPDLMAVFDRVPGFDKISESSKRFLLEHAVVKSYGPKTSLVVQGQSATELYILTQGKVDVVKREETGLEINVATLEAPTVFGEIGIIRNVKRTASVISAGRAEVIVIGKDVFDWMVTQIGLELDQKSLLSKFSLSHYIASSPMFKSLPAEAVQLFAQRGTFESFKEGDVILREGEVSKSFYLLLEGKVEVSKDGGHVADLKQGDFFGEIALIADTARVATVTAREKALILRLDQKDFWDILSTHIQIAMMIEAVAEIRLEEARCSA